MKLLAVDTSTASCSVALFDGDRLLAEALTSTGSTHSRHLLSMIDHILKACACKPAQIGGVAVARGPGTFTGLRIGLSTVKGLAAAIHAPVVGVNSLAALAYPFSFWSATVAAVIDARRGEVYCAHYRCSSGLPELLAPIRVAPPETVAAVLPGDALVVGSGALLYRAIFEARSPQIRLAGPVGHLIRAASVGRLAMARFERRDVDCLSALTPEYVRASDARIPSGSAGSVAPSF